MAESTVETDPGPRREPPGGRRGSPGRSTRSPAHGAVQAQMAYLGERGARIVLVGEDGAWGDLVAPTYAIGRHAVEHSGATAHEDFDGEMAAKVRTGPYEWSRMAGIQIGGRANT